MKMNRSVLPLLAFLPGALLVPLSIQAQSVTYTYSYTGAPLPIFRDSANIITIANLFIPRAILISKVTVNVDIDYPRPGDINLFLYSAIATRTKLVEKNCGSQGTLVNITFDDSAPTKYSDFCPSSPGTYRGNEPLSNSNGQVAFGVWSLTAENNGSDDFIGYLRGYTLTFTGIPLVTKPTTSADAVFNAAGFQSAVVSPGEMVNIEGLNLGPSPAVVAPAGNLPMTLGGVQVTFDGAPAALSYVSPAILTAQVPFSVTPGNKTAMVITYQSNSSDTVNLDVLGVVPGVYTQSGSGRGPVTAIHNSDGSVNSLTNPAAKNTYVTVYAAGLGTVKPPLATGQAPPASLSPTTAPVSAYIDGYPTTVSYAGAAPGFPGLYQINLQIPLLSGAGARSLTIFAGGGLPSQNFVTIYVQ